MNEEEISPSKASPLVRDRTLPPLLWLRLRRETEHSERLTEGEERGIPIGKQWPASILQATDMPGGNKEDPAKRLGRLLKRKTTKFSHDTGHLHLVPRPLLKPGL